MNYRLPILAVAFTGLVGFGMVVGLYSQVAVGEDVASTGAGPPPAAAGQEAEVVASGQDLVSQAAQRLLLAPGIEARTRQRVNIFGQQLVGSGTYLQLTHGPRLMLRLDLKLQVGDRPTSLRQISDGDSLWVLRQQEGNNRVSRVNVRRLRDAAAKAEPAALSPSLWMALGGAPCLLAQLEENFQFGPPQPQLIGKLPVWYVSGTWKPHALARLLPEQSEAILAGKQADLQLLPEHLPHGVTLILGRDQVIPLFPYSFSFHRDVPAEDEQQPYQRIPLVTWELFQVRVRSDLPTSEFDFRPADQEIDEQTEEYLHRLERAVKSHSAAKTPQSQSDPQ